jgi:hypothetical protein
LTVSLIAANEEECITDLKKIISEVHKRANPLRPYRADRRIGDFVEYSDNILSALNDSLKANICLSQHLADELMNYDKKQRLMTTFVAVALLNARPLLEFGSFKRENDSFTRVVEEPAADNKEQNSDQESTNSIKSNVSD